MTIDILFPFNKLKKIKYDWIERFATSKFTLPHMNTVLAEMWDDYNIYATIIIINSYKKTPLNYPKKP